MRWTLLLLVACNQVYGLEPTRVLEDPDDDQVFDDDNCPTIANADQLDRDGDGVGDVCDHCGDIADPTNHDEDGDRFGDLCDRCPVVADFQEDLDSDGVSNACENINAASVRSRIVLFDSLRTLDAFTVGGAPWITNGDSVSLAGPADDPGLIANGVALASPHWQVELGVFSPAPWRAGDRFGIHIVDGTSIRARCEVRCDPKCRLFTTVGAADVPASLPFVTLHARLGPNSGQFTLDCGMTGLVQVPELLTTARAGTLVIVAAGQIELTSVAAINHGN